MADVQIDIRYNQLNTKVKRVQRQIIK